MTEFYGYAPAPGAHMLKTLEGTDTWTNNQGAVSRLSEMDPDYLLSVLGYLMRHGRALWSYAHPGKELPADRAVVDWLAARPLWRAVVTELRHRKALGPREDIFGVLRIRAATYRAAAEGAYSESLREQERLFLAR